MTQKAKKVLEEFRALSKRDQKEFFHQVTEEADEITEWSISPEEVDKRIAAADSGQDEVIPLREAMKRLRERGAKLTRKR